jgi:hypothetical protein
MRKEDPASMIGVEVHDGLYIVTITKCTLVLTKAEFIQALRRGKWWRRREALNARGEQSSECDSIDH